METKNIYKIRYIDTVTRYHVEFQNEIKISPVVEYFLKIKSMGSSFDTERELENDKSRLKKTYSNANTFYCERSEDRQRT